MVTKDIGKLGEQLAVKALKKARYKIIERNFNARIGEIDIIAKDKEYLCFVEVRMRKSEDYGSGAETVNIYKQQKIIKAAGAYLLKHNLTDCPCRFDVVSITGNGGKNSSVELIKDAFEVKSGNF